MDFAIPQCADLFRVSINRQEMEFLFFGDEHLRKYWESNRLPSPVLSGEMLPIIPMPPSQKIKQGGNGCQWTIENDGKGIH